MYTCHVHKTFADTCGYTLVFIVLRIHALERERERERERLLVIVRSIYTHLTDCDVSGAVANGNQSTECLLGVHVVFEFGWVLEGEGANMDEGVFLLQLLEHVRVELLFFNDTFPVSVDLIVRMEQNMR